MITLLICQERRLYILRNRDYRKENRNKACDMFMKKKTILISAVIAAATIIAFKHIFNKEEEEYFLNENYPFGSNAEKNKDEQE